MGASEMHIRNGSLSSSLIGDSLGDEVVLHSLVVLRSVLRRVEVSPQTVTSAEVEESRGQQDEEHLCICSSCDY